MYLLIVVKKSLKSSFGKIQISNKNPFSPLELSSKTSPFLLEKLVYIGQLDTYDQGTDIAFRLLGITTNDTAIYRLTDSFGEISSSWLEEEDLRRKLEDERVVYVQVDGSMILTREDS
jgi:hypothetical protein